MSRYRTSRDWTRIDYVIAQRTARQRAGTRSESDANRALASTAGNPVPRSTDPYERAGHAVEALDPTTTRSLE